MNRFKKRDELPCFFKLPYRFDIKKILHELKTIPKDERDDLRYKNSYGDLVGSKTEKLQKTFGLRFKSIEDAYSFLQNNDVLKSELTRRLPQNRRMQWDFRKYITKRTDGNYDVTGSPYKQIAMTEFNPKTTVKNYKVKIPKNRVDERHYNKLKSWIKGTYIEEALKLFKGEVHRVRVAVMNPGAYISEHIDYNTDYSVRYHIPIITNKKSGFYVKAKGKKPEYLHMPSDGGCWFLNQGHPHSAWNKGNTIRTHIIISVYGQQDICKRQILRTINKINS